MMNLTIYAKIYAMIYKQCSFLRKQLIIVSPFGRIPQSPSVTAPFRQGSLWICADFNYAISVIPKPTPPQNEIHAKITFMNV